ncbi:hypothetical protein F8M41_018095 [Gigaspora margarita]|uniref:Uncharacterized protein n=1 Tax=Gigaspora margarita TaxID=4874 RepID=A0A8H4B2L7_GIGMA|nr:hypothetical protein F8M41_018095 [Gigaspora margarita]
MSQLILLELDSLVICEAVAILNAVVITNARMVRANTKALVFTNDFALKLRVLQMKGRLTCSKKMTMFRHRASQKGYDLKALRSE